MNDILENILQGIILSPQTTDNSLSINPQVLNSFVENSNGRNPEEWVRRAVSDYFLLNQGAQSVPMAPYISVETVGDNINVRQGDSIVASYPVQDFVYNDTYIGGNTEESRNTWWNTNNNARNIVQNLNNQYDLPSNLLQTLFSVEGSFVDAGISNINYQRGRYTLGTSAIEMLDPSIDSRTRLIDLGYDIVNENGEWEKIQPYLKREIDRPNLEEFFNEKDELRQSGFYEGEDSFLNSVEIIAAKNRQLLDKVEKDAKLSNIDLNEEQKAYWTNVYWNTGETKGPELLRQYKGEFIPPTYNGRVTAGTNGLKFLRQLRSYADGGTVDDSYNNLTGNITIREGVDYVNIDPNLKDILSELSNRGVSFEITSAKSDSGHSTNSRHYTGEAVDIVPAKGETFDFLLANIRRHPDIIRKFQDAGYGLLDETKGGGQGWTGAHLHVGRDSKLDKNNWNTVTVKDSETKSNELPRDIQVASEYFYNKGLNPIAISGIVGNVLQEATENTKPNTINGINGVAGISSWRSTRQTSPIQITSTYSDNPESLGIQLDEIYQKITSKYPKALEDLLNANSPEEASSIFNKFYDNEPSQPGSMSYNRKVNSANELFDSLVNNKTDRFTNESLSNNVTRSEILNNQKTQPNIIDQVLSQYLGGSGGPEAEDMKTRSGLLAEIGSNELIDYLINAGQIPIAQL